MESYECAYRDPKSPLTPIMPMEEAFDFSKSFEQFLEQSKHRQPEKAFVFNFEEDRSTTKLLLPPPRRSWPVTSKQRAAHGSGFKRGKLNKTSHLGPMIPLLGQIRNTKDMHINKSISAPTFKRPTTPICKKPLSPRVHQKLSRIGMLKYAKIFEDEEIDYTVFMTLSDNDLLDIGVLPKVDRKQMLQAIYAL